MDNREEYQGKMENHLREWGPEIDKLTARADKAAADTKFAYYEHITSLLTKQESVQAKLKELIESSDDSWGDLKEGLDQSWNRVKDAYNKAAVRFM